MIALYIIAGIILFFCLLFSLNLRLYIAVDGETRIRAGVGPVVITVTPRKKKKVRLSDFTYKKYKKKLKKDRDKKAKKELKAKEKRIASQAEKVEKANSEGNTALTLAEILELVGVIKNELGPLFGSFRIDIRTLSVTAVGEDASKAAVNYGRICALLSALLALLDEAAKTKIRDGAVRADVDYLAKKQSIKLDLYIRLRIFALVRAGWHILLHLISSKIKSITTKS